MKVKQTVLNKQNLKLIYKLDKYEPIGIQKEILDSFLKPKKKKKGFTDRKSYRSPRDKKVNGLFEDGRKTYVRKAQHHAPANQRLKTPSTGDIIYTKTLIKR
jgi:hypothetical protein